MHNHSLPLEPPEDTEDPRRRIDALVEAAVDADSEGRRYDAEILAGAAAALIVRSGETLYPCSYVAAFVEPGLRARAAGRVLPRADGSPEAHLALLRTLAAYADVDGRGDEASAIRVDADSLGAELGGEGRRRAHVREAAALQEQVTVLYHAADQEEAQGYTGMAAEYRQDANTLVEAIVRRHREVVAGLD